MEEGRRFRLERGRAGSRARQREGGRGAPRHQGPCRMFSHHTHRCARCSGVKDRILSFDAKDINNEIRDSVKSLIESKPNSFKPEVIKRSSVAAAPLAQWVTANIEYATVLETVGPLQAELEKLEKNLHKSQKKLDEVGRQPCTLHVPAVPRVLPTAPATEQVLPTAHATLHMEVLLLRRSLQWRAEHYDDGWCRVFWPLATGLVPDHWWSTLNFTLRRCFYKNVFR